MPHSKRKNSVGLKGAVCLSAVIINNKVIRSLNLNENNLELDGGMCLGRALEENNTLAELQLADNRLTSDGAILIIKNATQLIHLNLAGNELGQSVGLPIAHLLKFSKNLRKLQLQFNNIETKGVIDIAKGLLNNTTLVHLNLRQNKIEDEGI